MELKVDEAFSSLIICVIAAIPIFVGAILSQKYLDQSKERNVIPGALSIYLSVLSPILMSFKLLGFYFLAKVFSEEMFRAMLSVLSVMISIFVVKRSMGSLMEDILPNSWSEQQTIVYCQIYKGKRTEITRVNYVAKDVFIPGVLLFTVLLYSLQKFTPLFAEYTWMMNNLMCLLFSINCIKHAISKTFGIGCILLIGMVFYEMIWVNGTDMMGIVSFFVDSPLMLVIPRHFYGSEEYLILGFWDIVAPGLFIAFLYRFDKSTNPNGCTYFTTSLAAYVAGLIIEFSGIMHKAFSQAPLLYVVPLTVGAPLLVAGVTGDASRLLE